MHDKSGVYASAEVGIHILHIEFRDNAHHRGIASVIVHECHFATGNVFDGLAVFVNDKAFHVL
jgi:hypothetical protein